MTLAASILFTASVCAVSAPQSPQQEFLALIKKIQSADYRGERDVLENLYQESAKFLAEKDILSRVHYWRGFALWRRAINGFNENVDSLELERDLVTAHIEFSNALVLDPKFDDARIGSVSCLGYAAYANLGDNSRVRSFIGLAMDQLKNCSQESKTNPRYVWVRGPNLWNTPVERGGGQDAAITSYLEALKQLREAKIEAGELDPQWGEPELLMNLAWSYNNKKDPDKQAAEKYAREALALVPDWHYVKDILLPQILDKS